MTSRKRQLIAITGHARSGKSEILKYVVEHFGFTVLRPSDIISSVLQEETGRTAFGRTELRDRGLKMRQTEGPDCFVKRLLDFDDSRLVIDGLRNLTAARTLQNEGGHILGVVARPGVRLDRAQQNPDNKIPPSSVEAMLREEAPEMNSLDKNGMHVLPILWLINPDHIIDTSDLPVEEGQRQTAHILTGWGIHPMAPTDL